MRAIDISKTFVDTARRNAVAEGVQVLFEGNAAAHGLLALGATAVALAELESLDGHARVVNLRVAALDRGSHP